MRRHDVDVLDRRVFWTHCCCRTVRDSLTLQLLTSVQRLCFDMLTLVTDQLVTWCQRWAETACVHRGDVCVQRDDVSVHREDVCVQREDVSVHIDAVCVHRHSMSVDRDGMCPQRRHVSTETACPSTDTACPSTEGLCCPALRSLTHSLRFLHSWNVAPAESFRGM